MKAATPRLWLCATACALLALTSIAHTFSTTGGRWTTSSIVMQMQIGASPGTLIDGSGSWDVSAERALSTWNQFINGTQFRIVPNSTAGVSLRNGVNNVAWEDDMYGEDFGDAVAVTIYMERRGAMTEADVLFDRARNWNSYRGNIRRASGGGTLLDFHRVALHEFGHVLGLDHPDEAGQSVSAVMNSRVSNTDALTTDDISGVRSIYGGAATPSPFAPPPANRAPAVAVSCAPCEIRIGEAATVTAVASDPDGDLLTYQWTTTGGTLGNAAAAATAWTAPADPGTIAVTVTVRDPRGGIATATVNVTVRPRDTLMMNERLMPGQYLQSANGYYRLLYQTDGNLVLYDSLAGTVLWASDTSGSSAGTAVLQADGNFVIYGGTSAPVFYTGTQSTTPVALVVQSDGNLVLYVVNGPTLWDRLSANTARRR